MTTDFPSNRNSDQTTPGWASGDQDDCRSWEALDVMKRDRFELLSAYLDGEVTADERRQVETWLDNDAAVQKLYQRLLLLRQGFQVLSVPAAESSIDVDAMVDQVVRRANRPSRRLVLTGSAIAAVVVGTVSAFIFGAPTRAPQFAERPDNTDTELAIPTEGLQIALDKPIIEIPKAPTADSHSPSLYQPNDDVR